MNETIRYLDGNEAVADVAYRLNEVCAIYPITPSSPMAEWADQWSSAGRPNLWGDVPTVVEMQSEAGAAGALHGALQRGALATTFTASQGLLLMIPNLYKIAGELNGAVLHVASRALATQALSIFGDHSDVMACRATGCALLCAATPQEAHDFAAVAQAASLASRIPFIHFFDGFRTSHEINRVVYLEDDTLRALVDPRWIEAHRARALDPDRPFIRGTAQNPDVFFQSRETVNPRYRALPGIVEREFDRFAALTGRRYAPYAYHGAPDAERVVVLMGSATETAHETVDVLCAAGERVGVVKVRLFQPFDAERFAAVLPGTVRAVAVLDRTKEPGAVGEPLYQAVVAALLQAGRLGDVEIAGGRYGLGSKEFTPAMAKAVFDAQAAGRLHHGFTVGITDDLTGSSLAFDPDWIIEDADTVRCVFYGLGSDGTVGANKNSIKIIGEAIGGHAQGYFVYDSKKSGSQTVSHLRFGPKPIRSTYLVQSANFVGCHQFRFALRQPVLERAAEGAVFLLNSPYPADAVWNELPRSLQETILRKRIRFYVIDADRIAREVGLGGRINTIMQTAFFAVSGVLDLDEAVARIKAAIEKTYGGKGRELVTLNHRAVDAALGGLEAVAVPERVEARFDLPPPVPESAPPFVREVTAMMMAGRGDSLPVGRLPEDGTYPSATARWEKRAIAAFVPEWDAELCIQCGECSLVCPHSVIRSTVVDAARLTDAPGGFKAAPIELRGAPDRRFTLQFYVDDCTGCGLCVEVCPARSPESAARKALTLRPYAEQAERARRDMAFFESLPQVPRHQADFTLVRGVQFLQPLFEFPGACAGCGETPYLKLISQLFGDRMLVANATGCSSIYGGNLPTTPWSCNGEGRGPAWSNSLFEDNAEFGFGFRVALDQQRAQARRLLEALRAPLAAALGEAELAALLAEPGRDEGAIAAQRERLARLDAALAALVDDPVHARAAHALRSLAGALAHRSVWLVGGDGWAYDIGSAGLDHVLASGRDVNILVLDTEVYSNTGGQMSKATPLGAVAKFASGGKRLGKKDLALQAIAYGDVYVARIALGANPQQALQALYEAERYPGPSLVIAYAHCIAHGIDMRQGLAQQHRAVACGHWPLMRFDPRRRARGENPFLLDAPRPRIPLREYAAHELRYTMLRHRDPDGAERLMQLAEQDVRRRWAIYEELAERGPEYFPPPARDFGGDGA